MVEIVQFFPSTDSALAGLRDCLVDVVAATEAGLHDVSARIVDGIPHPASDAGRFAAAMAAWGFPRHRIDEGMSGHEEYFESLDDGGRALRRLARGTFVARFGQDPACAWMWQERAASLQGFCIVYDKGALEEELEMPVWEVRYVDSPPVVDSFVFAVAVDQRDWNDEVASDPTADSGWEATYLAARDEAQELMGAHWRDLFCVLPSDWAWQREMRMLMEDDDRQDLGRSCRGRAVRQVIMGERMPRKFRQGLIETVRSCGPHVQLAEACALSDTFRLAIEPYRT
jgi:hypothetical protein